MVRRRAYSPDLESLGVANPFAFTQGPTRSAPHGQVSSMLRLIGWGIVASFVASIGSLIIALLFGPAVIAQTGDQTGLAGPLFVSSVIFSFVLGTAVNIAGLFWVSFTATAWNIGAPKADKHALAVGVVAVCLGGLGVLMNFASVGSTFSYSNGATGISLAYSSANTLSGLVGVLYLVAGIILLVQRSKPDVWDSPTTA